MRSFPAIGLQLRQQYGPFTQDYARRVEAIGGRFDRAGRALTALDRMIYGEQYYAFIDARGKIADFWDKFAFLYAPVSDFAGIVVPIKGVNFINNGFATGNYSVTSGLACGASRYLDTNVLGTSLSQNDCALAAFASSMPGAAQQAIGVDNNSNTFLDIGATTASTVKARINRSTSTNATRSSDTSNCFMFGRRSSSASFEVWSAQTATAPEILSGASTTATSVTALASQNLFIGATNRSGTAASNFTTPLSAVAAFSPAIANAEMAILYQAWLSFHAARSNL